VPAVQSEQKVSPAPEYLPAKRSPVPAVSSSRTPAITSPARCMSPCACGSKGAEWGAGKTREEGWRTCLERNSGSKPLNWRRPWSSICLHPRISTSAHPSLTAHSRNQSRAALCHPVQMTLV
jgi:hypothetical protein